MADTKQGNQNKNVDDLPESQRMRREAENDVPGNRSGAGLDEENAPSPQQRQPPPQQGSQQPPPQQAAQQMGGGNA